MNPGVQVSVTAVRRSAAGRLAVLALIAVAVTLAACGDKKKDKPASQTAAKVNKEEITVHQINFVLSQQRAMPSERAASAGKQVLDRLIDQELAVQKAQEQKLDRDSRVLQQLEAARREIIARAYVERIGSGAAKPTPAEIKAYYEAHPALFKERKLYSFQELSIEANPDQVPALKQKLLASKDVQEFVEFLKSGDVKFAAKQAVLAAEQLPLANLDRFAAMKDGERTLSPTPQGAQALILVGTRAQPVDEQRATPAIEQFLLNERKRKMVEDDLKALRGSAKIEYIGEYAKGTAPDSAAPAASEAAPEPVVPVAPSVPQVTTPSPAPQIEVAPLASSTSSAPTTATVEKGLGGMK
jgi:EpsD family peptidyl-prolyl cis-trans isomerase